MKKHIMSVIILTASVIVFPALSGRLNKAESEKTEITEYAVTDDEKDGFSEPYRVLDVSTGEIYEVPVREYVIGAVCAEMPSSFHSEALKAQAVASHTYAERQRMREKKSPTAELCGADFSNDTSKYQGYYTEEQARQVFGADFEKSYKRISEITDEVLNSIIVYNDEPVIAAFHSMSSGETESAENVWGTAVDYLLPVDSGYDTGAPRYTDEVRYSREILQNKLETAFPDILLDENFPSWLNVADVSPSGTVLTAIVGNTTATGMEIRNALALRSPCFEIRYEGDEAVITTKGYGHGVGMSQYGANCMAAEGKTWKEILMHYYTGCEIKTIG